MKANSGFHSIHRITYQEANDLINEAMFADHPAHDRFDWSADKYAHHRRIAQARKILAQMYADVVADSEVA